MFIFEHTCWLALLSREARAAGGTVCGEASSRETHTAVGIIVPAKETSGAICTGVTITRAFAVVGWVSTRE